MSETEQDNAQTGSDSASGPMLARLVGITKRFGPVTVLEDVDFDIRGGEVHIMAGENGAGKSTLIKILAGVHTDFGGQIEMDGQPVEPKSPQHAAELGVAVIHQELSLVQSMSVADNIFLGRNLTIAGVVDARRQRREARRLLERFAVKADADQIVETLPIATQQLIEIAKAVGQDAKVVVMDEPTSALSAPEAEKLFGLIDDLRSRGCGIVYISHKMEEIERIADRITVLRDGRQVGSAPASQLPVRQLIQWMVGRDIDQQFPREMPEPGAKLLDLERITVPAGPDETRDPVHEVSLSVRAGEIVGLAGLEGSGNSQLLTALFGGRRRQGVVRIDGEPVDIHSPSSALANHVALLTNDRKATGLVMSMSIVANATLAQLPQLSPGGWRRPGKETHATRQMAKALNLRAASLGMNVAELSGGNQQKVALAKWMLTEPRLLLLDEPTRGVDVGAKREIYQLMNQWSAQGIAIIMISSEMPEMLGMSDRIVVMHRGQVSTEIDGEHATADQVLAAAMGQTLEMAA